MLLPKKMLKSGDFLSDPDLKRLKAKVEYYRDENIGEYLFVYEKRKYFPEEDDPYYIEDNRPRRSWNIIRKNSKNNRNNEKGEYEISKNWVKKYFLRGWCEVSMFKRGNNSKQVIYIIADHIKATDMNIPYTKDCFIADQTTDFSIGVVRSFWKKYLSLPPKKRKQNIKIIPDNELMADHSNKWQVCVEPELKQLYYGNISVETLPGRAFSGLDVEYINCLKSNEGFHLGCANFDMWQNYLHHLRENGHMSKEDQLSLARFEILKESKYADQIIVTKIDLELLKKLLKGGRMSKRKKLPLTAFEQLKKLALEDSIVVSKSVMKILEKISQGTLFENLPKKEQKLIEKLAKDSPKVQFLFHRAKHQSILNQIALYMDEARLIFKNKETPRPEFDDESYLTKLCDLMENKIIRFIPWFSEIFQHPYAGQLITAADIPEEKKMFRFHGGEITISYLYKRSYGKSDGNEIQVRWIANISPLYELWIIFINPQNQFVFSEFLLGRRMEGGKIFPEDILNFNPSKDIWAAYIALKD
jgi:hypothetical protein